MDEEEDIRDTENALEDNEDLVPGDDSIFETVVNDVEPGDQSTDSIVEDSFSSLLNDSTLAVPLSPASRSTPLRKSKRKAAPVPEPAAPVLETDPGPSSPRRSSRLAVLAGPSYTSPARPSRSTARPSPSRSPSTRSGSGAITRSRSSSPCPPPARQSRAPARSSPRTTRSGTRSRSSSPCPAPAAPQTGKRNNAPRSSTNKKGKAASESRIKCSECPSTFANTRTFAVHKKMHALKRCLAKAAKREEFFEQMPNLLSETLDRLLKDCSEGNFAMQVKEVTTCLKNSMSHYGECHEEFYKFLVENVFPFISDAQGVFSSSLSSVFYVGVNKLQNSSDFIKSFNQHVMGLCELSSEVTVDVLNFFAGSCMFELSKVLIVYTTRKILGSTVNDEIRRKRSTDKLDSITFLQMCYHIGGCVVKGFVFKGGKYGTTNPTWASFLNVLNTKFKKSDAVGNACVDSVTEFTREKDRGGLTHISQEALDFFVVLFDLLMSLEGHDGSLPENVVTENVLADNTILCLWDVLVGGTDLSEDCSLDFCMQMAEACKLIVIKGIMLRRLNDHFKKAYDSLALRSRLAETKI